MKDNTTAVVFRAYIIGCEVIAIFPYQIHSGYLVDSYMRQGQHSGVGLDSIIGLTRPASETEAAKLRAELTAAPYSYQLREIKRINYAKFRQAVTTAQVRRNILTTAASARKAGQELEITSESVTLDIPDTGECYQFQHAEFELLMKDANETAEKFDVSVEDAILHSAQGW